MTISEDDGNILTIDVDCPWCIAKAGEPCHLNGAFGQVHLARTKNQTNAKQASQPVDQRTPLGPACATDQAIYQAIADNYSKAEQPTSTVIIGKCPECAMAEPRHHSACTQATSAAEVGTPRTEQEVIALKDEVKQGRAHILAGGLVTANLRQQLAAAQADLVRMRKLLEAAYPYAEGSDTDSANNLVRKCVKALATPPDTSALDELLTAAKVKYAAIARSVFDDVRASGGEGSLYQQGWEAAADRIEEEIKRSDQLAAGTLKKNEKGGE